MFTQLRRLSLILAVMDIVGTQLALLLADVARREIPLGRQVGDPATFLHPAIHLIVALVFPAAFLALSVYDVRRETRPVGDPASLARAVALGTFLFAGVLYFTYRDLPRLMVGYFFVAELALLSAGRLALGLVMRRLRRRGHTLSRVLLVGVGEVAARAAQAIQVGLGDSVMVLGCVDDEATEGPAGLPLLGKLADVPALVNRLLVDDVIVALPASQYRAVEDLVYGLLPLPVRVRLVPDYLRLVVVQSSVEALGGIPLIGLREPRITGPAWATKRLFDVVVTLLLVLLTWPLLALIALAIRLDSAGPIIFRQQRVGENGRLFWMYKFRTMCADAEARGPKLGFDARGHPLYKWPRDQRVTRVGHWLRRTSLDEMPQFFNVLRGDMSLVGPRPETTSSTSPIRATTGSRSSP
jgi:exopolysaccharide biosynthesis polyprenyl glycosylphosphotransferase